MKINVSCKDGELIINQGGRDFEDQNAWRIFADGVKTIVNGAGWLGTVVRTVKGDVHTVKMLREPTPEQWSQFVNQFETMSELCHGEIDVVKFKEPNFAVVAPEYMALDRYGRPKRITNPRAVEIGFKGVRERAEAGNNPHDICREFKAVLDTHQYDSKFQWKKLIDVAEECQ